MPIPPLSTSTAVRVGLVGAGPWAAMVHAPLLAAGPATTLAAVWARRFEAAEQLALSYRAVAAASFDELLDRCEAVAFAVPPDVQAQLAPVAARAGKALLLEKPLADSVPAARRIVEAVEENGVPSLVFLTARFTAPVRRFLDDAASFDAVAAVHEFLSGALVDGPFSHSPWRHQRGMLLDLGPHAFDLLSASLGPVAEIRAEEWRGWVRLDIRHQSGALSTSTLSGTVPDGGGQRLRLFGPSGTLEADLTMSDPDFLGRISAEFAETIRTGRPHPCDARRGLELQELVDAAEQSLRRAR